MLICHIYELYIELAIDVFKTQKMELVHFLKDFLAGLPNSKCIEEILTNAIYLMAETDPDGCRGILRNYSHLEPEISLPDMARQIASKKLVSQGFLIGKDFGFESNGKLVFNPKNSTNLKSILMTESSPGDRLLIEEILQVRD